MHRISSHEVLGTCEALDSFVSTVDDGNTEGWSKKPGAKEATAESSTCLVEDGWKEGACVSLLFTCESLGTRIPKSDRPSFVLSECMDA